MLREGQNCCGIAEAERASILVDGCNYFSALEDVLRRAKRSIVIVGWDFDGHIRLCADRPRDVSPPLGKLLRTLVEENEQLEIRILVWSVAVLHAPSAPTELLIGNDWQDHPRIQLRLDATHPIYGAHHQKIVCVDGAVAFVGGMDLTVDRWDTAEHKPDDQRRHLPNGEPFGPVHDIHMVVDGEAAHAICRLAHTRWAEGTGEVVDFEALPVDLWPTTVPVNFVKPRIGISRTQPEWGERKSAGESWRLTIDMLRAARRSIFIEAQYFTAAAIGDILEERLREPDGPEVVVLVSFSANTLLERKIMGENRNRLVRRLVKADRYGRFRIYSPMVRGKDGDCPILVHSKLIIVDDRLIRIGSSNLNNRSIGLDSELDLTIEARSEAESDAIASFRNRLLAEHLDTSPEHVATECAATLSLSRTIENLNTKPRHLKPIRNLSPKGPTRPVPGTWLFDPKRPFEPLWFLRRRRRRD